MEVGHSRKKILVNARRFHQLYGYFCPSNKIMLKHHFYKYHGTGNDFIILDNRDLKFDAAQTTLVGELCNRRFGIGADGFILLQNKEGYDFEMVYFNSDGNESTMCGNGGRCIVAFAQRLGIFEKSCTFLAIDGPHEAMIESDLISLKMQNVKDVEQVGTDYWLDTGSPHYVTFVDNVDALDVFTEGQNIRNSERFHAEGTNVNFVEERGEVLAVRTYERGVEDETYSCGTGVTAIALCAGYLGKLNSNTAKVTTPGGNLEISFEQERTDSFKNIWLKGPAKFVFEGDFDA